MDFSIIDKAGLTKAEAASIIGVSDVMLWKYMKQGNQPRETYKGVPIRLRCSVTLAVLSKLVELGKLPKKDAPFSKNMDPEQKARREAVCAKLKQLVDDKVAQHQANS